ncbi:ATP-binding protein [Streptomyces sp. NPDC006602]|uniref:ATP-binding protein n=1 Tax=Streptomyces sp. NPDC006602 TaxID=3364751 RepID=UPI0036B4BEB1
MTRRLGTAFGVLTGLIVLVGGGVLTGALLENATNDEIVDRVQPSLADNLRLHGEADHMQRSIRGYLITGDPEQLEHYREALRRYPAVLADARDHGSPETDRNLAKQEQQLKVYLSYAERQAKAVPRSAEAARLTREAGPRYEAFEVTNHELERQLTVEERQLQDRADTILHASAAGFGVLLATAMAAAVYTALRTTRGLVRPLKDVERALGRLTAGDHSARAKEQGPTEIRAVARSVNTLADEGDRLRGIQNDRRRLSEVARRVGIEIRERLDADQVLDAACAGIGEGLKADHVFVMLTEGESPVVPVARGWSAKKGLLSANHPDLLPPVPAEVVREHYRQGTTWVIHNLPDYLSEGTALPNAPGSFGEAGLPKDARAAAEALGLCSVVVTPIGVVADEPLGAVLISRCRPDNRWREVEIEIAESMASGLGRALHNSLLYSQEARLVEELRGLDRAKSEFLSTVSHELRTPLTSIVGYIELLMDEDTGPLSEPQRRMLDVVDRNANRLRALIEDLLTLSRIESGPFSSQKAPVDLRRLVSSAVDAIQPAATAASIDLETDCPQEPLILEADSEQLDRVLMNLLSNAVKFTPGGGQVSVRAAARDGEVELSVSDTGIGIPAKDQKELFNRFFRASNATDAAIPGTGLGLTIVRTIVANHGGEMEVRSQEGEGTTVTARLPLAAVDGTAQPT